MRDKARETRRKQKLTEERHRLLEKAKLIVVKLGSAVVIDNQGGFAFSRVAPIMDDAARLIATGKNVILVSSGAVGLGAKRLGLQPPLSPEDKQDCAAKGQPLLMGKYEAHFEGKLEVSQYLVTGRVFSDEERRISMMGSIRRCMSRRGLPICNNNDPEAINDVCGDNDHLAALLCRELGAQVLILVTEANGLYTADPRSHPDARLIPKIREVTPRIREMANGGKTTHGTGGMASKVQAASLVAQHANCATIVVSGTANPGVLGQVCFEHEPLGTLFSPMGCGTLDSHTARRVLAEMGSKKAAELPCKLPGTHQVRTDNGIAHVNGVI